MEPDQSPEDAEEREIARGRQTRNLMIAGGVLLLLPLVGAAIVYFRDTNVTIDPGGSTLLGFQRRFGDAPVAAPAPTAASAIPVQKSLTQQESITSLPAAAPLVEKGGPPQSGGSLGFITGGSDYAQPEAKPAAEQSTATAQAQTAAETKTAPIIAPPAPGKTVAVAAPKAPAKQPFVMPKLQATKGSSFSSFGQKQQKGAQAAQGGMPPGMPPGMAEMMKGMPAGGMPAGMPDMSKMMQGGGAPGGMPDMSKMMQQQQAQPGQ